MADYAISSANLNAIESNLSSINSKITRLDSQLGLVDSNVKTIYKELDALATEFQNFVNLQVKANTKSNSQQRLIQISQELEKNFGHYDLVRRTTTGILQADDLAIVKKETISNITEELMISTPKYWLAPSLVALSAWINDQPELAEKALKEGIKRDDEKTSLFWALVSRRASRKAASLKWTQRYLANQDHEKLDRKAVIVLDAFASGLLGADSEGVVFKQVEAWLEDLSRKPGFVENQNRQWSDAILLKRKPLKLTDYPYLRKYSNTWPGLNDVMEGAYIHEEILTYFQKIFEKESSTEPLKVQLDEILTSLVTDFDEEERELKKEQKYHQLIVEFDGDEKYAKKHMDIEKTAFDEYKDFTQLLTDIAMKPESANASVSTQKFAIALSKDWIIDAYNDVIAENRMKIPHEINIDVDTFHDISTDGNNEKELIDKFNLLIDQEKEEALSKLVLSAFDKFCYYGGMGIAALGFIKGAMGSVFIGLIAIIAGVGMVIHNSSKKKAVDAARKNTEAAFEEKRIDGAKIIRAILAEIVDFRAAFRKKDSESEKVLDFLEQIRPEQYVRKLSNSNRRIKVSE